MALDAGPASVTVAGMSEPTILQTLPLGARWGTADPFLFCVHHDDAYPPGNEKLGPAASLAGRNIGQDFEGKDGWRMYHGDVVPGFPGHPHRGFETVTIVRRGLIDHSDSLGAAARFGRGDVQWLTAGGGIVHSEMFPLLDPKGPNPVELFQIWLNLPAKSKLAPPYFTMQWAHQIPRVVTTDDKGRTTDVMIIAGALGATHPLAPPPSSWAAQPDADVAIWTINMQPGATWTLPRARGDETGRVLYSFNGDAVIAGDAIKSRTAVLLRPDANVTLEAGEKGAEMLLLQGRPIGEPVAQHGPFVMNTRQEIVQAFADYQNSKFGGWPWPTEAPTHARERGRFARHADGREEVIDEPGVK